MENYIKGLLNVLKEFHTDDSGKLSMGRILMALTVTGYLTFTGYLVVTTKTLPDFPPGVAALVSLLYAANKFSPTNPFTRETKS